MEEIVEKLDILSIEPLDDVPDPSGERRLDLFTDVQLLVVGEETPRGIGLLCPTTHKVIWSNGEKQFSISYESLTMHAICTDPSFCAVPCLYCQVSNHNKETVDSEDGEDTGFVQVQFIPQSEDQLAKMFAGFSKGVSMHPDLNDTSDAEEGDVEGIGFGFADSSIVDSDVEPLGDEEAARRLSQWDSLLVVPGQFDDAQEQADDVQQGDENGDHKVDQDVEPAEARM